MLNKLTAVLIDIEPLFNALFLILLFVDYRILGRMGEGTFSEVLKCQSLVDGRLYACKKMKQKYDR